MINAALSEEIRNINKKKTAGSPKIPAVFYVIVELVLKQVLPCEQ